MEIGFAIEHPGIVLWEEYLQPIGISQSQFAHDINISTLQAREILNGECAITPDTALRLARYLGTSAEFWLNWQSVYDLQQTARQYAHEYTKIQQINRT